MFRDPGDCSKYGREVDGPARAKIFQISDLLAMQKASRSHCDGPTLRAWTYVLLSSSLFLRKAEAAALTIGDIEVPLDRVSGNPLLNDGLPKYLYIHIRRSKTDQDGHGKFHQLNWNLVCSSLCMFHGIGGRLLLRRNVKNPRLCPLIALMTWLSILRLVIYYTLYIMMFISCIIPLQEMLQCKIT